MSAIYELVFRKPTGEFVAMAGLRDILSLDYTMRLNTVGQFSVTLPSDRFPVRLFGEDYRIEIWRKPRGGSNYLEGETCWFVSHMEATRRLTEIHAISANGILQRHIIAYQDELNETQVLKDGPLDTALKQAISENTGVTATSSYNHIAPDTPRYWTPYFKVQTDTASWPVSRRRITQNTLYDVAQRNSDKGTHYTPDIYYFFDIVQIAHDGVTNPFLEFRTYVGQRGTDRRGYVVFSEAEKTLTNAKLFLDWGDSVNRIYAGGPGKKSLRIFATADDPTLAANLLINPFATREKFVTAKKATDLLETQEFANDRIAEKEIRPYRQLQATLTESACNQYGVNFFFGDHVTADFLGESFDTFVNPVHVHVEGQKEVIEVQITEKINLYVDGLARMIRQTNQVTRRLDDLETIDDYS